MNTKIENAPEGVTPKCPYCERRLDRIWVYKKGIGIVEQKQIIMCPHCEAFLGYGTYAR